MELSKIPKERYLKYYVLGFVDGEGCFSVSLKKQETTRFGWVLDPVFHVTQQEQSRNVLELVQRTLNCGRIIEKPGQPETMQFLVDNRRQLNEKIIPFFNQYELLVKKKDFELFRRIVEGLERKEHTKLDTFRELVKLAFHMNMEGKQRRYQLEEVLDSIKGSSETTRETAERDEKS
ncbi:MAG: LAGLIDADG family homing endonuclease [Nitrososphaera sp.]|nr:LAGLIDADG family homing endonuclease [Nitrososphaera sp.]